MKRAGSHLGLRSSAWVRYKGRVIPFQGAKFLPSSIVESLHCSTALEFQGLYADMQLLLVRVGPEQSDLLAGLTEVVKIEGRLPANQGETLATVEFSQLTLGADPADGILQDQLELLARLDSSTHFVVPLLQRPRKPSTKPRKGRYGASSISVGRYPDNDVVLADPAVSNNHAYFDAPASGALTVTDAESRNGTRLNGKLLEPGKAYWLQPMDHIQFSSVSTFICQPALLRKLLKLTHGTSGGFAFEPPPSGP